MGLPRQNIKSTGESHALSTSRVLTVFHCTYLHSLSTSSENLVILVALLPVRNLSRFVTFLQVGVNYRFCNSLFMLLLRTPCTRLFTRIT